ncbi:hypothetical protein AnigIFM59636_002595 [Aspergillus niger]|uniref:Contig An08c0130, genomic contig n=3 Tax=Aspergillus niger TaxID=5061 RepID=A2QR46_ASPNC|nr:uncharacterized protein An08g04740 [Aspergillus niger]RDH19152.1 hypothetical protein M747DRAFT_332445 [Aspergillus niger ATCC 13496]GKZ90673.1 hypothetical protein AnigIFM59636_002595 [Aspergillus niger]CAK45447.1 unnamed protein product [Aspergillus niger]
MARGARSSHATRASRPSAAACEVCRHLKMRCIRPDPSQPCDRCRRNNRRCDIPPPRPLGRRPGAVGRYNGFEKSYRKMQAQLKKAPVSADEVQQVLNTTGQEELLQLIVAKLQHGSNCETPVASTEDALRSNHDGLLTPKEPVSNPLALLADASSVAEPLTSSLNRPSTTNGGQELLQRLGCVSLGLQLSRDTLAQGLNALYTPSPPIHCHSSYFRPPDADPPRDVGPDLDPIELGLLSLEDAHTLFSIYFVRLHPINGILDPILHTVDYVRSRSALLFTWILAITAQFDHQSASCAKRLRLHGEMLSRHVHTSGYKSVEIVQGYYISLLSATPASALSEERSWLYTSYAVAVATELGLDQANPSNILPSDSVMSQRQARNSERTWLRILLWERATSAAYGRATAFPESPLTRNIDKWWHHPLADSTDKDTCAFILLRRYLAGLHRTLHHQASLSHDNPHWVRNLVDSTLDPWRITWLPGCTTRAITPSPNISTAFLTYVYLHNRLWTLSFALHTQTIHSHALQEDCFMAAVQCCTLAVHDLQSIGEPLYCLLSPTWAMIAYAATLALRLFPALCGTHPGDETELLALLGQVALQLEKAGSTPSHRTGIAAVLGRHLLSILRARVGTGIGPGVVADSGLHCSSESGLVGSSCDPVLGSVAMGLDEGFADVFREVFGPGWGLDME